jgi:ribosomal protection tetracycline resistance protein
VPLGRAQLSSIEAVLPAALLRDLQRRLPALTRGEGVLESRLVGYEPVTASAPTRRRTTPDPLNREEYTLNVARRVETTLP